MCCRITLVRKIGDVIEILRPDKVSDAARMFLPSYNASPGQQLPLLFVQNSSKVLDLMKWGIINSSNPAGQPFYNARMEGLLERKSFRGLMASQRAILIADGYFEWRKDAAGKIPYRISRPDGGLLPLAALWTNSGGENGFTVVTREPLGRIAFIHDRMPAIVENEQMELWLNPATSPGDAKEALCSFSGPLEFHTVSRSVNSTANNSPECIRRVDYAETPDLPL